MHCIEALQDTVLKRKTLDSTRLLPSEKNNFQKGKFINCHLITDGTDNHWAIKPHKHSNWWYAYKPHCQVEWDNLITYYHFKRCFKHAKKLDIDAFFQPFNNALSEYEINTVIRIAAFIAQIAHESCSLKYKEELASGTAYEGRRDLGNIYRGDGRKYKGRGIIQLTGRHNYDKFGRLLGLDLISNPTLATQPNTSCRIAALYWANRNLNKYADWNNIRGFRIITKKINGGYNGWSDRVYHWEQAKKVLHC